MALSVAYVVVGDCLFRRGSIQYNKVLPQSLVLYCSVYLWALQYFPVFWGAYKMIFPVYHSPIFVIYGFWKVIAEIWKHTDL